MSETIDREALWDLEFPVEVWLGSEKQPLDKLLRLQPGGVLRLEKDPDGPVDLVVNGSVVASGELVVIDGKFGFRIGQTEREGIAEVESEAASAVAGVPEESLSQETSDEKPAFADEDEQEEEMIGGPATESEESS